MSSKWHYQERGRIKGPLTAAGLVFLLERGAITQKTLVRKGAVGDWRPASVVMAVTDNGTITIQEESVTPEDLTRERSRHRSVGLLARLRPISGAVEHVADLLIAAVGRFAMAFTRRGMLVTGLVVFLVLLFRKSSLLETPIADAYHRLSAVWTEAQEFRREDQDEKDWERFALKAKAHIAPLASELKEAQDRPPDVWDMIFGVSEDQEEARNDLVQVACNELPALLSGKPSGGGRHASRVKDSMNRVSDYLDGKSPYSVVRKPKQNNDVSPAAEPTFDSLSTAIIAMDIVAVLGGVAAWFWWRRTK